MSSIIPNRKPDTPVQPLITVGNYKSTIEIDRFKRPQAIPGPSSSIFERNKQGNQEINIKPITQIKPSLEFYNPRGHLKLSFLESDNKDVALNSLHSTKVYNRKIAALNLQKSSLVEPANELDKNSFIDKRNHSNILQNYMSATVASTQRTPLLAENHNYISQNENQYYKSEKTFFKPNSSQHKYPYSTPDFLRVDEKGMTYKPGETVTVVSRSNGWLTVDPNTMSRKNAFEKQLKGNLHKTSHMSPQWMQTEAKRDEAQFQSYKPQTVKRQNIRCESSRLFLSEKYDMPKSVFNIGQIRHNLLTKEEAQKQLQIFRNTSTEPVRFLEWKENQPRQTFDAARVTGKIGQQ
ncbi:UNKNOWN [Stylonychia lemnae]|uniref:Uncharacterized protein n=1 Tax=Stylonychia lemnae TaxID=5949 RepID=A0A078AA15_STYLE|nr:UNKNOWN [Stylonychia lemnae]|eukprot:CDW77658.1 UNKNOWN [Stylonychia lemnae]